MLGEDRTEVWGSTIRVQPAQFELSAEAMLDTIQRWIEGKQEIRNLEDVWGTNHPKHEPKIHSAQDGKGKGRKGSPPKERSADSGKGKQIPNSGKGQAKGQRSGGNSPGATNASAGEPKQGRAAPRDSQPPAETTGQRGGRGRGKGKGRGGLWCSVCSWENLPTEHDYRFCDKYKKWIADGCPGATKRVAPNASKGSPAVAQVQATSSGSQDA